VVSPPSADEPVGHAEAVAVAEGAAEADAVARAAIDGLAGVAGEEPVPPHAARNTSRDPAVTIRRTSMRHLRRSARSAESGSSSGRPICASAAAV
jgi:hypothetical protein